MDNKLIFLIYCIEEYKAVKNMSGRQVYDLFQQYRVIEYIKAYYDALHTTGPQYIIDDIDLYIAARKSA